MKYIDINAPKLYPKELERARKNLPFQVFSSATNPAKGKAIKGPTKDQNIVAPIILSATLEIYIVLPISSNNAEKKIIANLVIFNLFIGLN